MFDGQDRFPVSPSSLNIKANILIDETGHARIADFGLLTIISDPANLLSSSSYTQGGTARWMSPELIAPQRFGSKNSRPTKASDCYALGMVIYETVSGNLPFHEYTDLAVFVKVLEGERPPRGARFTNSLWKMLGLCWTPQPNNRPGVEDVLRCLEVVSNLTEAPSPGVDEETEGYSDWDSASSFPSVSRDRDANTGSPDLSDFDVDQATDTTDAIPTLPPPPSPPISYRAKTKPAPSLRIYGKMVPQVNLGGLSVTLTEGIASGNSGSGTVAGVRPPIRKIVGRGRVVSDPAGLRSKSKLTRALQGCRQVVW